MYNEILIECANLALFGVDDAIIWPFLGAVVGGVVNAVGNLINSSNTKKTNQANIDATQEENEKAREFEETMYNKYESIPAQAQQYREAGLNPLQAISPQSIGHASTSPIPQSQSPQFGNALIDAFPSFLEAGTTLRQQRIQRQEEINKELENWMLAFEKGNAQEQYNLLRDEIQSRIALTRADKKKRDKELEQLDLTYNMAKDAYDKGINQFEDAHNLIDAQIKEINSRTDLTDTQKAIAQHSLSLSKKFDEEFLNLDLSQRKQEVEEFLENSENRKEYNQLSHDLYVEIQKLSKYEITEVKSKLSTVESILADDLLNSAIDDDKGRFDTVMLKMFMNNPVSVLQVASNFVPGITYAPTTKNFVKNIVK